MTGWPCPSCGARVPPVPGLPGLGRCAACDVLSVTPGAREVALPAHVPRADEAIAALAIDDAFAARFRLERVLGTGAFAAVFLARQLTTERAVALKFLRTPLDSEDRERFMREGQALARVNHPSVVRVFDADQLSGYPFLALEHVDGGSLKERLNQGGPLALPRFLELMAPLLEGLAACHEAGIVHRDLKSENVLLTRAGEPKLADMGLARLLDAGSLLTGVGQRVGTPRALAPEVIAGDPAGPPADIYAAGVMMYELLTGEAPFVTATVSELLMAHLRRPPPSVREKRPDLPPGLDSLVRRCLAKNPADRPASASELRDALARIAGASGLPQTGAVQRGAPAETLAVPRRAAKGAGKKGPAPKVIVPPPGPAAGPALALVTMVALAAIAAVAWHAGSAPPLDNSTRFEVIKYGGAEASAKDGVELGGGVPLEPGITALAVSPDARFLASSGNRRGVVSVWDAASGRCVRRIGDGSHSYAVNLAFNSGGDRLAIGWHGGAVDDCDLATGVVTSVTAPRSLATGENQDDADPLAVGWLDGGKAFAVAIDAGQIGMGEREQAVARVLVAGRPGAALAGGVRWNPRPLMRASIAGGRVASVDGSGTFRVWDAASGKVEREERGVVSGPRWAWHAGARRVAFLHTGADELEGDNVVVWDLVDHRIASSWKLPPAAFAACQALELADAGRSAILGISTFGVGYTFEWRLLDAPQRARAHIACAGWPGRLAVAPDGKWVAYADNANELHLVSDAGDREPHLKEGDAGHHDGITALAFAGDGRLVSADMDRRVLVRELAGGRLLAPALTAAARVERFEVDGSGSGALVARLVGGASMPIPTGKAGTPGPVAALPARWEARAHGRAVEVRERGAAAASWKERGRLVAPVSAVAVSPRGDRLVAGGMDGEVRVWNLP